MENWKTVQDLYESVNEGYDNNDVTIALQNYIKRIVDFYWDGQVGVYVKANGYTGYATKETVDMYEAGESDEPEETGCYVAIEVPLSMDFCKDCELKIEGYYHDIVHWSFTTSGKTIKDVAPEYADGQSLPDLIETILVKYSNLPEYNKFEENRMNYVSVKRAVAAVRKSLKEDLFTDGKFPMTVSLDTVNPTVTSYPELSASKFIKKIVNDHFNSYGEGPETFFSWDEEEDPINDGAKSTRTYKVLAFPTEKSYEAYALDAIDTDNPLQAKVVDAVENKIFYESRGQNKKTSRIKESGIDEGHTIVALDELIKDMESAGVIDFADDLSNIVDGAYNYGFEDREISEELFSIYKEMKHTRDPLILDYADELYDIVKPYIKTIAKYIENENKVFKEKRINPDNHIDICPSFLRGLTKSLDKIFPGYKDLKGTDEYEELDRDNSNIYM